MSRLSLRRGRVLVAGLLGVLTLCWCLYASMSTPMGADYPGPSCAGCDYAGPPIEALARGDLHGFFATQPFMGPVTLVLRAPVVAATRALSGGELLQYRLGALICLLLSSALAWLLVGLAAPRGVRLGSAAAVVGLLLAGPLTAKALSWGHPEELFGGLLCAVAVLLGSRGRPTLAGLALGTAVATKQWAVLAVLPAALACPQGRRRLVSVAVLTAAVLLAPMFIGDAHRFLAQNVNAGLTPRGGDEFPALPTNIWFPYAHSGATVLGAGGGTTYWIPAWLGSLTHPMVLAGGVLVPLVYARLRRPRGAGEMLLMLALVFLLRCVLDPVSISYHHTPFFVAVAAFELISRRRIPYLTLYVAAGIWILGAWVAPAGDASLLNECYLAWALPAAGYLAYRLFGAARGTARERLAGPVVLGET